jgi:hypothetical protein
LQELKQLSDEWHRSLRLKEEPGLQRQLNTKWKKSAIKDFILKNNKKIWTIKEITSGKLLHDEGEDMGHCVFSYLERCITGKCFIFSVGCKTESETNDERIATVEISKNLILSQVMGRCNSPVNEETKNIVIQWTDENKINSNSYIFNSRNEIVQYDDDDDENNDLLNEHNVFEEEYFENIDNETVDIYGKNWTINSSKGNRKFWYYANKYGSAYNNISYKKGKEIILTLSYMNKVKMIILISENGFNNGIFTPDGSLIDKNMEYYCILRWLEKKGVRIGEFQDNDYDYEQHDVDLHFEEELDFPYTIK